MIGVAGGGGLKQQPGQTIGISEVGGDHGSAGGDGVIRHAEPLPTAMAPMVPGWEEVDHGPVGEGGAVPDRLHHGDRL